MMGGMLNGSAKRMSKAKYANCGIGALHDNTQHTVFVERLPYRTISVPIAYGDTPKESYAKAAKKLRSLANECERRAKRLK